MISGFAINTLGFPSYLGSLASISPKERETDSFPGSILKGPRMMLPFLFLIEL